MSSLRLGKGHLDDHPRCAGSISITVMQPCMMEPTWLQGEGGRSWAFPSGPEHVRTCRDLVVLLCSTIEAGRVPSCILEGLVASTRHNDQGCMCRKREARLTLWVLQFWLRHPLRSLSSLTHSVTVFMFLTTGLHSLCSLCCGSFVGWLSWTLVSVLSSWMSLPLHSPASLLQYLRN